MRPLPSFLLLCASYGVTAIVHGFSTGKNGLDYCIAEADTTSDMTASTTTASETVALLRLDGFDARQARRHRSYAHEL